MTTAAVTNPFVRTAAAAALVCAFAGAAHASVVVAPNAYAGTLASASGLNTFNRDTGNPRTGQLLIGASQLGAINVGDQINGITWRLFQNATTAFPATAATWADYTIRVGEGVAFGSQSLTFATNFVGAPTTVRSGPLTINAGSFLSGSAPNPNPFGSLIAFTTPYIYTGGNLVIEVRHTGSNIVNTASDFFEVALVTDPGYNVNFWAATATGAAATTGVQNNFAVSQLSFTPVPAPSGMALLGLGGLIAARRKR